MVDRVGQQLGNYTIVRKLGEGAFADVYLGEHIHLGTYAAIKVLHTQLRSGDIEKFRSEARTVAHLIHPHIVRVLEFGVEGSTPFLVMDYATDGTLRQRHPRGTRLSLPTVVDYVNQIAAGLQYAHDKKLIHRDVKPENMLIGQGDYILLSDFGVALISQSSRSQRTQEMAGTFAYMAPEQIQGKPRLASDQYALGIVTYEWLTGDYPFHGSLTEMAAQHLVMTPPPLREQVPTIPQAVEKVVNIALAKDPHNRYSSVQTFAGELQRASQQQSTHVMSFPITPFPSLPFAIDVPTIPNAIPPLPPTPSISSLSSVNNDSRAMPVGSHVIDVPVAISPVTPVPPFPSNMPVAPITPFPSTMPVPPPKKRRSIRKLILAVLALLILLLGGFGVNYSIGLHNTAVVQQQATMTSVARITATAGAKASDVTTYDTGVAAQGIMFGFNTDHTHYNPYERILSPANVSGLVQDWTVPTGLINYSSPVVANGIIYVGLNNSLYAFDAKSRAFLWKVLTGGPIFSSPAVYHGIVYVGSLDGNLYAHDANKSGKWLWHYHTGNTIYSSPAVVNGMVYVGSDDDYLYALDAKTGNVLWKMHTGGQIDSSPAFDNGVIYVGSKDGNLYAFDANNKGKFLWKIPMGGISSPAVVDGMVYGVSNSNLYAYDTKTRRNLWSVASTGLSPAVANGIVYVGSSDGNLYAFNAISGKQIWKELIGKQIIPSPTIANGVVYIGSADGNLYALNAKNGANLWANPIGVHIESSPTVAYGVVYVVSSGGQLYAFHLPGVSAY